jgi:O-methyltransferase
MDALTALYAKVSTGGVVIIDDYGAVPGCQKAVHDFRDQNGIDDAIRIVDRAGVWWIKSK